MLITFPSRFLNSTRISSLLRPDHFVGIRQEALCATSGFLGNSQVRRRKGAVKAGAPSVCPHQRGAHEAHVTPASQFIQEGGTPKPPGPLRSQAVAVDQQDRNPVGLLVGPGPGIQR
ncbi:hypothetical protein NDU88_005198 [Pleurodeles waltl]|uniref:Uncharacterized protein n=1 Tax=Pleurodeles waltl TaxID=8319 RepID=A0AAV7LNJ8_PLEWA|nr:hypothetical protein NDU88_005198 [Pleurodeles waltl]